MFLFVFFPGFDWVDEFLFGLHLLKLDFSMLFGWYPSLCSVEDGLEVRQFIFTFQVLIFDLVVNWEEFFIELEMFA